MLSGQQTHPRRLLAFCAGFCLAQLVMVLLYNATMAARIPGAAILALLGLVIAVRFRRVLPAAIGMLCGAALCAGVFFYIQQGPLSLLDRSGQITFVADDYAVHYEDYSVIDGRITEIGGRRVWPIYRARFYLEAGAPDYIPGNRLEGFVSFHRAPSTHGYLASGTYLTVRQRSETVSLIADRPSILHTAQKLAHRMSGRIRALLPGDEAAFLDALLTGRVDGFSDPFQTSLYRSGSSHIVSVSGMHVSLLCAILYLTLGKRAGMIVAVPCILFYAAIAGFSPPITRAVIMTLIMILAFALGREHDALTSLGFALFALCLQNPFILLSASTQLSFAATLGIILFTPMFTSAFRRYLPKPAGLRKIADYVYSCTAAALGALVFSLPISGLIFGQSSILSLPTGVLVLWTIELAMALGIVMLVLSLVSLPLAGIVAVLLHPVMWFIVSVISWVGGLPFAMADGVYVFLVGLGLIPLFILAGRRDRAVGVLLLTLFLLVCAYGATEIERRTADRIAVHYDNGKAVLMIGCPDGVAAIAYGGDHRLLYQVKNTLRAWGGEEVDALLLTWADEKGTGLAVPFGQATGVKTLYLPEGTGLPALPERVGKALTYMGAGALTLPFGSVSLLPDGQDGYAALAQVGDFNLLSVCRTEPWGLLSRLDDSLECDILLIDAKYLDHEHALAALCARARPALILAADDIFSPRPALPDGLAGRTVFLSESGSISIRVPRG